MLVERARALEFSKRNGRTQSSWFRLSNKIIKHGAFRYDKSFSLFLHVEPGKNDFRIRRNYDGTRRV